VKLIRSRYRKLPSARIRLRIRRPIAGTQIWRLQNYLQIWKWPDWFLTDWLTDCVSKSPENERDKVKFPHHRPGLRLWYTISWRGNGENQFQIILTIPLWIHCQRKCNEWVRSNLWMKMTTIALPAKPSRCIWKAYSHALLGIRDGGGCLVAILVNESGEPTTRVE
jgi:hypothetical protein